MWWIEEHRRLDRQLVSAPRELLAHYEKWKDLAVFSGPFGLRLMKGLHDEALSGQWSGYRSSRLGLKYRIIYKFVADKRLFEVVSITAHDYRRT